MPVYILAVGVFAVGIKFREPLMEFFELVTGFVSNVAKSIWGKIRYRFKSFFQSKLFITISLNEDIYIELNFTETFTYVTLPLNQLQAPLLELIFGPSPPLIAKPELKTYPLFGPMALCFFSKTHAPFTVVLNKQARTFDMGRVI